MTRPLLALILVLAVPFGCHSDDDEPSEADRLGLAAQCAVTDDCPDEVELQCLTQFKGGYCGLEGCSVDEDCPEASACVAHDDGNNYCFRICRDKAECNANRDPDNEANCSSNITFTDGGGGKACVPPSD